MATEEDVRRLALALPEVAERPSYGTPGYRVKDKLFARIHRDGGVLALWTADMVENESFIDSGPREDEARIRWRVPAPCASVHAWRAPPETIELRRRPLRH